ncbi:MAG: TRAP transporter small permease [Desulfobacteraceae bacterium]|nr:MAG: TRAP transporter small permease [Desulfobacteraceae bacterium]
MARISRFFDHIEKQVLVWTILALALIGFIQVVCRYLFNYSFTWYEELGRYLGVFIAFLGAATGVKYGMHFSMDALSKNLKKPWKNILSIFSNCTCALFFAVVAYYSWKVVGKNYTYETTSAAMNMPMYLAYLPIPVFSLVMTARHLKVATDDARDLRK